MATQTQPLTRDQLAALPDSYFKAVDAKDVDAILVALRRRRDPDRADRPRRLLRRRRDPAHVHRLLRTARSRSSTRSRTSSSSPRRGKVATEQSYIGELNDGTKNDMHNCNFFDVDADGKFSRVIIWMAGTNPLK